MSVSFPEVSHTRHERRLVSMRDMTEHHSDYLINSGELLTMLREDWLRLRTDSLKFSGLANILQGSGPLVLLDRGRVLAVAGLSRMV